ncbi:hypothetical protein PMAYCL1PPCAC_23878 [Pristionchus mayeri]|uniref:Beta-1,4-N-acetylgalactosaminyltransferase n=1 Tax=Pristionchus mayeri TaxID=1317129 RepID=A0AAN5I650_9BILA|nr:hypothetical protein PMAYCL1PPCAC_23878 [Pristionchus mayeri]
MHPRLKIVVILLAVATTIHILLDDGAFFSSLASFNFDYHTSIDTISEGTSSTLNESVVSSTTVNDTSLCPATPKGLVGKIRVWMDGPSYDQLEKLYSSSVEKGGHSYPHNCIARHKVAIIVPYRDRDTQLRIMLHNLHALLTKQQLDYGIYIVEQIANQTFNRAKLMNVGFDQAIKEYGWECFVFHDVDLLPEDDRNLYSCPAQPRHMSVAVDKFNYQLPYGSIFGGISALTREHVEKINGFSNDYWGWGGEDDDLSTRVSMAGYKISRYPAEIARYKMIKHSHESSNKINKCRYKLMGKTKQRWMSDGISSLNYNVTKIEKSLLFTRIIVDLLYDESILKLRKTFPSC